jgi:hypothetical protein
MGRQRGRAVTSTFRTPLFVLTVFLSRPTAACAQWLWSWQLLFAQMQWAWCEMPFR